MPGGLYGPNLSVYVPDPCTWAQAQTILHSCGDACTSAYSVFDDVSAGNSQGLVSSATMALVAAASGQAQMAQLKSQLDDTYARVMATESTFGDAAAADPDGDEGNVDSSNMVFLQNAVSLTSSMMATIDSFFDVDLLADLSDAIVNTADKISATVANTVAKMAGNVVGGLWWVILLAVVALLFLTHEKKELTS